EPEKLAAAVQTRIMMHAHLDHSMRAQLELPHQLHADRSAGRRKPDLIEQRAPDEPKVAVDIPEPYPEDQPREAIVDVPNHNAPPRIAALELVPVHQADARFHAVEQLCQLTGV